MVGQVQQGQSERGGAASVWAHAVPCDHMVVLTLGQLASLPHSRLSATSLPVSTMPKSKRNKIVHLTQVKKKSKDHKEDLIKQLEQFVLQFKRVFIFDFEKAKSDRIMALRLKLKKHGRIFSGKNSLASLSLKTVGTRKNIDFDDLTKHICGHRGLLFTDLDKAKLMDILDKEQPEFCKKLLGYAQIAPDASDKHGDEPIQVHYVTV